MRAAALGAVCVLSASALITSTASASQPSRGSLTQLRGKRGCVVEVSRQRPNCARARALRGPAPFTGSNAVAVRARNVYVASSRSDAVTVLRRSRGNRRLRQARGAAGCIGGGNGSRCAQGTALDKPTSVVVSPDGRNVYVAAMRSSAVAVMARSKRTGALTQIGCIAANPTPGCETGTGLEGVDVVAVSPDGANVYAGSFRDGSVAAFARDPGHGALTETGCISDATSGCTPGVALGGVEGLAVSPDGANVYAAAAIGNAVAVLDRAPDTGALTQPPARDGCLSESSADGCASARVTLGADAVAVSPDGESVYVAAGLEDGLSIFARDTGTGALTQLQGTAGCIVDAAAIGCALGQAFADPEGVAVSPDGANVYVGAFASSAVDVFDRDSGSGQLMQKHRRSGCIVKRRKPLCTRGRALGAANAIAITPRGGRVYAGAFHASAVAVFRRVAQRSR